MSTGPGSITPTPTVHGGTIALNFNTTHLGSPTDREDSHSSKNSSELLHSPSHSPTNPLHRHSNEHPMNIQEDDSFSAVCTNDNTSTFSQSSFHEPIQPNHESFEVIDPANDFSGAGSSIDPCNTTIPTFKDLNTVSTSSTISSNDNQNDDGDDDGNYSHPISPQSTNRLSGKARMMAFLSTDSLGTNSIADHTPVARVTSSHKKSPHHSLRDDYPETSYNHDVYSSNSFSQDGDYSPPLRRHSSSSISSMGHPEHPCSDDKTSHSTPTKNEFRIITHGEKIDENTAAPLGTPQTARVITAMLSPTIHTNISTTTSKPRGMGFSALFEDVPVDPTATASFKHQNEAHTTYTRGVLISEPLPPLNPSSQNYNDFSSLETINFSSLHDRIIQNTAAEQPRDQSLCSSAPSSIASSRGLHNHQPHDTLYQISLPHVTTQQYPGNSKFLCPTKSMRWVRGPELLYIARSAVLIIAPAIMYISTVGVDILHVSGPWAIILSAFLTILSISTLFITSFSNPGILPRNNVKFDIMIHDHDVPSTATTIANTNTGAYPTNLKYCYTCHIYRPKRTIHCAVCDNCVLNFDHHCPHVGQCIGAGNYHLFLWFLWSLIFSILFILASCIYSLVAVPQHRLDVHNIGGKWNGLTDAFQAYIAKRPFALILIGYCLIATALIATLWGLHILLSLQNITTNEYLKQLYGGKRAGQNPYARSALTNWLALLMPTDIETLYNVNSWKYALVNDVLLEKKNDEDLKKTKKTPNNENNGEIEIDNGDDKDINQFIAEKRHEIKNIKQQLNQCYHDHVQKQDKTTGFSSINGQVSPNSYIGINNINQWLKDTTLDTKYDALSCKYVEFKDSTDAELIARNVRFVDVWE